MDASMKVAELKAARGVAWITEAFALFRAAPLAWISMCAGWVAITWVLVNSPFRQFGFVIAYFIQPVFFASFAIAGYKQGAGERITLADLFSAFRRNVRSLLMLGAVLLLALIAINVIMIALGLPTAGPGGEKTVTLAQAAEIMRGKEWIVFTGLALMVIVTGALWFAPPLIAFHGMGTLQAMRWSIYAAISNIGAMLVYAMALTGLLLLVWVPLLSGMDLVSGALGIFLVIPLASISTYVGYRDVFEVTPR